MRKTHFNHNNEALKFISYKRTPNIIITAATPKIKGHNLKGRKETLNPVINDKPAIATSMRADNQYIIRAVSLEESPRKVTEIMRMPMKTSVRLSLSHSIFKIFLLSSEISPKSFTTELVGNMWAIPQNIGIIAPI